MKEKTIIRINKCLRSWVSVNEIALTIFGCLVLWPFFLIYEILMFIVRLFKGDIPSFSSMRQKKKQKRELEIHKDKIRNREIPLLSENHVSPGKDDNFYFFEKRKLNIPYDKLVFVESEHNEIIHRFFKDNAEWVADWQKWHGWDLLHVDYDDIREGMFYPQDFHVFRHGFLWHSPWSSWDEESGIHGNIHYYYDIDPDSEVPIKEQMEQFMRKIYHHID